MKTELLTRICYGLDIGESVDFVGDSNVAWHQVALEGSWRGHWMGAFSLNAQMFDQMVDHFEAMSNDTVVDYEHASVFASDASPAAGWIKTLQARKSDDGQATLWAKVDWTKRAADFIRAREYRYLSPTIVFNTRDRKSGDMSGASLHSVALTNTPFLDELPEVRLNKNDTMEKIRRALRGANQQEEKKKMNEEQVKALAEALGLAADANADELIAAAEQTRGRLLSLHKRLDVADNATAEEALAKVVELKNPATKVDVSEVVSLRQQVASLRAGGLLEEATRAGKIVASNREWASKLAHNDPEAFEAWAASAPAVVPTETKTPPKGDNVDDKSAALSDREALYCKHLDVSAEVFSKFNRE